MFLFQTQVLICLQKLGLYSYVVNTPMNILQDKVNFRFVRQQELVMLDKQHLNKYFPNCVKILINYCRTC